MAINTFGLTVADDIQPYFHEWSISSVAAMVTWAETLIKQESAMLNVLIRQVGYDPAEVSDTKHVPLYHIARRIVSLRVSAEFPESVTHGLSKLSRSRREMAEKMELIIRNAPESLSETWKYNEQLGTWWFDEDENLQGAAECIGMDWRELEGF